MNLGVIIAGNYLSLRRAAVANAVERRGQRTNRRYRLCLRTHRWLFLLFLVIFQNRP